LNQIERLLLLYLLVFWILWKTE